MIAIVDYGVGNLFSLCCSLEAIGQKPVVTGDPAVLRQADRLILPGVGAFADAMEKLRTSGLDELLIELAHAGKPLLGICLGMQLLFDQSEEFGVHDGLGLIPGMVRPIASVIPETLKIPHIGWNALHFPENREKHPIFKNTNPEDCVYFVHSFAAMDCVPHNVIATTEYGVPLTAAIARGNVVGCQFHPEKSGTVGLNLLRAFCGEGEGV